MGRCAFLTGLSLVALLMLAACDQGIFPGRQDVSCEKSDPRIKEFTERLDQFQGMPDESFAEDYFKLLFEMESFLTLFPIKKDNGCALRVEDWPMSCGTEQFQIPIHGQELLCQQTAHGITLLRPPSQELELPEQPLIHAVRTYKPWNGTNRSVQDEGDETIGHVPVQTRQQKDPLPEDCDPHDPCAWEWKGAPFHYEIRGKKLFFHDIVDFVTKQLLCLDSNERCPPPIPFVP